MLRLWSSLVIKSLKQGSFSAAISASQNEYATIRDRLGPFDLAVLKSGFSMPLHATAWRQITEATGA
jgi:hypothetical protein